MHEYILNATLSQDLVNKFVTFFITLLMFRMNSILDVDYTAAVTQEYYLSSTNTSYNFALSAYIKSVNPDMFNMECVYKENVVLSQLNIGKKDLYLTVNYKGDAQIEMKNAQKLGRALIWHEVVYARQKPISILNCTVERIKSGFIT